MNRKAVEQMFRHLRAALGEYHVAGVHTNIEFLHRLTATPSFADAKLDTALIERERGRLFAPRAAPSRLAWDLAMLCFVLAQRPRTPGSSPWDDTRGWRPGAAGQRHHKLKCAGQTTAVKTSFLESTIHVDIGGDVDIVSGTLAADGLLEA